MNILGFNPNHHGSVCLLQDGEIKYFIEDERITRKKYGTTPYKPLSQILENYPINKITWASPGMHFPRSLSIPPEKQILPDYSIWNEFLCSFGKHNKAEEIELVDFSSQHHEVHAAHSFYNSGFKRAISVVIDGIGSVFKQKDGSSLKETETIFECSYPGEFKTLYKTLLNPMHYVNLSRAYETITMHLGWDRNEAGKTMGLSPYGKFNPTLPPFFTDQKIGDPEIFYFDEHKKTINPKTNQTFINEENNPQLKLPGDPREWHYNKSKITDLEKDIAWKIQNETQQIVGDHIEKIIQKTGLKQVCCAGGYFLNCVANYYLIKRFPDVEFYFEPISSDAGTAIGAAKLLWHTTTQDETIRPLKSLYMGKQYSTKKLLKGIKNFIT